MAIVLLLFTLIFVAIGLFLVFRGIWLGLIFAVVGGGLGLAAMAFLVERLQLILDAAARTATIRSRTMLRHRETELPLDSITHAIVEKTSRHTSGGKPLTRTSLIIADKGETRTHPITETYHGGGDAKTLTGVLNDWLKTHRST